MINEIQGLIEMYGKFGENENKFIEDKIIEMYEYNIGYFVRRHNRKNYYEDLKQELRICLLNCIRNYDSNSKAKFSTYVFKAMSNIMDKKIKENQLIRLPAYLNWSKNVISVESNIHINSKGKEFNIYDITSSLPNVNELKCDIGKKYNHIEKIILSKRIEGYSLEEIGKCIGKTSERVRQILNTIKGEIL